MGQYFELVNVDRKETISLGKLGESIYDTLGLFQYLARVPSSDGLGFWAGHRLITIGDGMNDCPAGMLTEAKEEEMNKWLSEREEECNRSYYSFAVENYRAYNPEKHITAPDDKIFILRNLSKRVYVREEDFWCYQQDKGIKAKHIWGFDQLILINTAWSANSHCAIPYPGFDIIPGPWAGDRFDITVFENIDSESWQDVTKQEGEKMVKIVKVERAGDSDDSDSDE